ncbi:hypothetical protein NP233_g3853 [Leucocoprinus birnbaumii]|uniref:Nephrocystin 3-like N-terminal domain-containing protein n=1 Tax=Leucocoprinus birnbaumii TaxID=56174 RepID=A0AAD5VW97_9AGAR|nr:hypothetical protein NP233_g3853 [Leucocoprinus birnbaumii]
MGQQPSKKGKKLARDEDANHLDPPQDAPSDKLNDAAPAISKTVTQKHEDTAGEYSSPRLSRSPANPAPVTIVSSNGDFFNGASDFAIHSMNVTHSTTNITIRDSYEDFEKSNVVIQRLTERGAPEAIHNSAYRAYPPRCHEETRQSMRTDIISWTADPKRLRRMRWYFGPAGVGKSAVAQSAAEELSRLKRLGATFCFSRPGKIDDPDTIIPTLVYQLAMKNARYKRFVTEVLGSDPLILSMDRATQFKDLILDPFRIIAMENKDLQPLVVIIDGLDECRDTKAQCELINLIRGEVERGEDIPLLWMLLSRPEWHLKSVSANVDRPIPCQQIEISVDDDEAQQDVKRLLFHGLTSIRDEYGLPASWPPREQLSLVLKAASGHLGFTSFILRFINDEGDDDGPSARFKLCVRAVSGVGIGAESPNPLELLDSLYREVLSSVPVKQLPHTLRILGFSIVYSDSRLSVRDQATFFDMSLDSFYQYLRRLHSVIDIPKPAQAGESVARFYHASFPDFLRDPARSRNFFLDEGAIHYDVAVRSLSWLEKVHSDDREAFFNITESGNSLNQKLIVPDSAQNPASFAKFTVWKTCRKISDPHVPDLIVALEKFDFTSLLPGDSFLKPRLCHFALFIRWLYPHVGQFVLSEFMWRLISLDQPSHAHKHLITIVNDSESSKAATNKLYLPHRCEDRKEFWAPFMLGDTANELPVKMNFIVGAKTQIYVTMAVSRHN